MKILAYIEVKKTTREEFEDRFPKHTIGMVDDRPFLCWCVMCPEPITLPEVWVFVDEDNKHLESGSSSRKAHAFHIYPNIEK